ncbi:MAG TPA: hypothetical protein VGP92_09595 [Acidimicrobiia bacterium]|nr:hypothetical protein [Acidimicrobiia bacterium]
MSVWDGSISPAVWAEAATKQVALAVTPWGSRRLTDARTAESSGITTEDVEAICALFGRADVDISRVRLAIVANQGWAIAQQVEAGMRKHGVTTLVFNDVDTACVWLGVDPAPTHATIADLRRELRTR